MNTYEECLDHLIAESDEDEVGLWYIVGQTRHNLGITDPDEVRRVTMQLVGDMLKSEKVVAADYASKVRGVPLYRPWRLRAEEAVVRIEREWDRLGHEPSLAEIVVFVGHNHPFTTD